MPPQPDLWTHTSCLPSPPPMREFYFLNHSQIFKRVYIPIRGSQSQLSKVSRQLKFSHIIWHMYQKPSLPPRNHTNLDPAIPHGRMSPRAIIKQVGLKKKKGHSRMFTVTLFIQAKLSHPAVQPQRIS